MLLVQDLFEQVMHWQANLWPLMETLGNPKNAGDRSGSTDEILEL
jgi:hypothetical protein